MKIRDRALNICSRLLHGGKVLVNDFLQSELVVYFNKTQINGLRPGQPMFFLYSPSRAHLFEEPTRFLDEEFVRNGRSPSVHTWLAAGEALKSWFQWLQAIKKDWSDATGQDRLAYRDAYLISISPRTGQQYEPSTIASRMRIVRQYYRFAQHHGWYSGDLASGVAGDETRLKIPISQDAMVHTERGSRRKPIDRDLPKPRPKIVIHPLQLTELKALINHCGPQAGHRNGDMRPARDRLFVDLGWMVGLRVDEIRELTTLQFLNLHPESDAPLVSHPLEIIGKGRKTRQVAIPGWLVEDAIAYINGERTEALTMGGISSRTAKTTLFLSGAESSRPGRPISKRRLQQIMEQACISVGLTKTMEFINPETQEKYYRVRQKHSVHDLRHTAAVLLYHAERLAGNAEPWTKVSKQLGHDLVQTTIKIYLQHVEIFGEKQRLTDVRKMIGI